MNYMNKERYMSVLFEGKKDIVTNNGFQMLDNKMRYYELNKTGLSQNYDKRIVLADGVSTRPLDI